MKRKILILLAVLIVMFAVPVIANAQIIGSGSCGFDGDNVTWTLDDAGTLTISGEGEMGYYRMVYAPWRDYFSDIKNLVIDDGVTKIGEGAFQYCENLTNITIADSVTSIGEYAFGEKDYSKSGYYSDESNWENGVLYIGDCLIDSKTDITECEIKDNCKVIADLAFYRRSELGNVTIPEGMRNIGELAFYECSALTEISVPDSIETVGYYAFTDTGYYDDESNWDGDLLYLNHCLVGAKDNISNECNIKNECKVIAGGAFKECDYTSIIVPDSVTYIGSYAFQSCSSLTNITIPDGITIIADAMLSGCKNLTSISIPESVTTIGLNAFSSCYSLSNITIPKYVTEIKGNTFCNCDKLRNIVIPNRVEKIDYYAFGNCKSLTDITIPESVTYIDSSTFEECGSLNITVSPNNPNYTDIDGVLFNKDKTELIRYAKDEIQPDYEIPDGVINIGENAFRYCYVKNIVIPKGTKSIGREAFYFCGSLSSITMPNSITFIDDEAFYHPLIPNKYIKDVYYGGTETEWNAINIESSNRALLNAAIHYGKFDQITLIEMTVTQSDGTYSITADTDYDGKAYAAAYDAEGALISIVSAPFKNSTASISPDTAGAAKIKFFVWTNTLQPVTYTKTMTLQ